MSGLPLTHLSISNGQAVDIQNVPVLDVTEFREAIIDAVGHGLRISALFGQPTDGGRVRLWAVLAYDSQSLLLPFCADLSEEHYPSLTPDCPQAHWFEREIFEQWAIYPKGHPWLKPIRFHAPYRQNGETSLAAGNPEVGVTDFFRVEGEEVHEVAVGPVHAGIIEPGHFRFQCYGEEVLHLEISLGYQHRGVERNLPGGPDRRTIHLMETLAGDTTIGHAEAYCQAVESLSGTHVSARAEILRGVALELERIANHVGDLGALAGDVGFLPTLSYCGRIRGDVLNMTALICGNRFGRGIVRPGGVGFDVDPAIVDELLKRLELVEKDLAVAVNLLWGTSSVMARFEGTGAISRKTGREIGLVGPAARACGIDRDVRRDMPLGIFQFAQIPVSTWDSGDVMARAHVRWMEIQRSIAFIREHIVNLPGEEVRTTLSSLAPNRLTISLVEGWRGEICHVALTDAQGRFSRYKVVDPSFHNWFGLAYTLRGQEISDFPLCNKSFNLSYCGHDL
ncbi:MAG: NADH-quinone oxidoreductase subunit C [Deltaproteobacteria bacterium]|nr:NADH-quinone oxidoreductase subunit C [Deltaproteobacteria bacterium]